MKYKSRNDDIIYPNYGIPEGRIYYNDTIILHINKGRKSFTLVFEFLSRNYELLRCNYEKNHLVNKREKTTQIHVPLSGRYTHANSRPKKIFSFLLITTLLISYLLVFHMVKCFFIYFYFLYIFQNGIFFYCFSLENLKVF